MSELSPYDLAPPWVWLATAASGVLAVGVYVVGSGGTVGRVLTAGAVVGVLYLLYQWGQVREKPTSAKSDREKEMKAQADWRRRIARPPIPRRRRRRRRPSPFLRRAP